MEHAVQNLMYGAGLEHIMMPRRDFIKEHKHLIHLLRTSKDPKFRKEAEDQLAELNKVLEGGMSKSSGFIRRMMAENALKHQGQYRNPSAPLHPGSTMNKPVPFNYKKLANQAQNGTNTTGNPYGASPFIQKHFGTAASVPFVRKRGVPPPLEPRKLVRRRVPMVERPEAPLPPMPRQQPGRIELVEPGAENAPPRLEVEEMPAPPPPAPSKAAEKAQLEAWARELYTGNGHLGGSIKASAISKFKERTERLFGDAFAKGLYQPSATVADDFVRSLRGATPEKKARWGALLGFAGHKDGIGELPPQFWEGVLNFFDRHKVSINRMKELIVDKRAGGLNNEALDWLRDELYNRDNEIHSWAQTQPKPIKDYAGPWEERQTNIYDRGLHYTNALTAWNKTNAFTDANIPAIATFVDTLLPADAPPPPEEAAPPPPPPPPPAKKPAAPAAKKSAAQIREEWKAAKHPKPKTAEEALDAWEQKWGEEPDALQKAILTAFFEHPGWSHRKIAEELDTNFSKVNRTLGEVGLAGA